MGLGRIGTILKLGKVVLFVCSGERDDTEATRRRRGGGVRAPATSGKKWGKAAQRRGEGFGRERESGVSVKRGRKSERNRTF